MSRDLYWYDFSSIWKHEWTKDDDPSGAIGYYSAPTSAIDPDTLAFAVANGAKIEWRAK